MSGDRKPMVKLCEVWERTSAAGNRYFSGFLGASQMLIFDDGEKPHPTRPGETVHVWKVLLQEKDQPSRPAQSRTHNAERGQRTWDRSRAPEETPFLDDSDAAIRDLERGPGR